MANVVLKPGHVRPVWAGHPWVFAQGIREIVGPVAAGDEVSVLDPKGNVLGRGLFSPSSAIKVRLYTRDPDRALSEELLRERFERALERRKRFGLPNGDTDAFRLLNAEGDGLPGVIVDCFGDTAMIQLSTIGMAHRRDQVVSALLAAVSPKAVLDRTPARIAKLEGFEAQSGVVTGICPDSLAFRERGLDFEVPVTMGHKTGYYLDMRALRTRLASLARDRRVLDCYAFIGAAGASMARGGAELVRAVESSEAAVSAGRWCIEHNGLSNVMRIERGNALSELARAASEGGYDLVLCDPPKLMPDRASLERARRAMQKIARAGALATRPGGLFVLCSCSSGLGLEELGRALAIGSTQAGRHATILERAFQDVDHPVPAAFPEGLYLSAVIAQIEV